MSGVSMLRGILFQWCAVDYSRMQPQNRIWFPRGLRSHPVSYSFRCLYCQNAGQGVPALHHWVPLPSSHHWYVEKVCSGVLFREWTDASLDQDQAHCSNNVTVEPSQKDQGLASGITEMEQPVASQRSLPALSSWNGLPDNATWPETSQMSRPFSVMLCLLKKRFMLRTIPPKVDFASGTLGKHTHTYTHLCRKVWTLRMEPL